MKTQEVLINKNHLRLLISINNGGKRLSVNKLSTNVNLTYGHTFKLVQSFEELGLVNSIKKGRSRYSRLTEKGIKVLLRLREIEELIK